MSRQRPFYASFVVLLTLIFSYASVASSSSLSRHRSSEMFRRYLLGLDKRDHRRCLVCDDIHYEHCTSQTCGTGSDCYLMIETIDGQIKYKAGCTSNLNKNCMSLHTWRQTNPLPSLNNKILCLDCCTDVDNCNANLCGLTIHAHGVTLGTTPWSSTSTISTMTSTTSTSTTTTTTKTTTSLPANTTLALGTSLTMFHPTQSIHCEYCFGGTCGLYPGKDPVVLCPDSLPYCMNIVHNSDSGNKQLSKLCASSVDCENSLLQNGGACAEYDPSSVYTSDFVCSYCCNTDYCNRKFVPNFNTLF